MTRLVGAAPPARSGTWTDRTAFSGMDPIDQPPGPVRADQIAMLRDCAERVKMARDLLGVFADRYEAFPAHLGLVAARELARIRVMLDRYDASDPTAGLPAGSFASANAQREYQGLSAVGAASRADALRVIAGLAVALIAVLERAAPEIAAPDVRNLCAHLTLAARGQLRAAQAWSGR